MRRTNRRWRHARNGNPIVDKLALAAIAKGVTLENLLQRYPIMQRSVVPDTAQRAPAGYYRR